MQLLQTNIKNFSRRIANAAVIAACMAGMMICITSCGKKHASAEELVQAYLHVDPQVIESGEIRTMSKTRLIVLLEGSYRQNES